jgi:hypothetical protein
MIAESFLEPRKQLIPGTPLPSHSYPNSRPICGGLGGLLELIHDPGHGGFHWFQPLSYRWLAGEARLVC